MRIITFEKVEAKVQERVEKKARTYGQEVDTDGSCSPQFKIEPALIAKLYGDWVMPLTKKRKFFTGLIDIIMMCFNVYKAGSIQVAELLVFLWSKADQSHVY